VDVILLTTYSKDLMLLDKSARPCVSLARRRIFHVFVHPRSKKIDALAYVVGKLKNFRDGVFSVDSVH